MRSDLRKRTLISFSILGAFFVLWGFSWYFLSNTPSGNPAEIYRVGSDFNAYLWLTMFRNRHAPAAQPGQSGKLPRLHGILGLSPFDEQAWRLEVKRADGTSSSFTLDQIKAMPKTVENIELKCIEGWSEYMTFTGVRFSDFLDAVNAEVKDQFAYVGLETSDGQFYVSVDMKSMLHSQTLLAYEVNGLPLPVQNGAPLRLVVPVKYATKSLKRIGRIYFSNQRPPDYWVDHGGEWYSSL